jgi:hypothetical protein
MRWDGPYSLGLLWMSIEKIFENGIRKLPELYIEAGRIPLKVSETFLFCVKCEHTLCFFVGKHERCIHLSHCHIIRAINIHHVNVR